jgi:hypothetical protein
MPSGKTLAARTNTASAPLPVPQAHPDAAHPTATMKLAVFSQPGRSAAGFAADGYDTFFRYEDEGGAVDMATWKALVGSFGNYICQPSADLAADARDAKLIAWLQSQDEPDNTVVNRQDANDVAGVEAVYRRLETQYAACKAVAPNKPVAVTVDLWQEQWGKADYHRIFAAADWIFGDFYQVKMSATLDMLKARIEAVQALAKGKRIGAFLNSSFIGDNLANWPGDHEPTANEVAAQLNLFQSMGVDVCDFPQTWQPNGFRYDGRSDAVKSVIRGWAKGTGPAIPPVVSIPVTTPAPALPDVLTVNGFTYDRRK